MHLRPIEFPVSRSAHVIFHITRAASLFWIGRVAEKLGNNGTERLCQNIMQNIQTTTVRHANDNFAEAELATALEDLFQRRNDRLTTIKTKALGPGIFLMKIPLKFCGIDKTLVNGLLTTQGKICLLYTSPSPRDRQKSRMPSSA